MIVSATRFGIVVSPIFGAGGPMTPNTSKQQLFLGEVEILVANVAYCLPAFRGFLNHRREKKENHQHALKGSETLSNRIKARLRVNVAQEYGVEVGSQPGLNTVEDCC